MRPVGFCFTAVVISDHWLHLVSSLNELINELGRVCFPLPVKEPKKGAYVKSIYIFDRCGDTAESLLVEDGALTI